MRDHTRISFGKNPVQGPREAHGMSVDHMFPEVAGLCLSERVSVSLSCMSRLYLKLVLGRALLTEPFTFLLVSEAQACLFPLLWEVYPSKAKRLTMA